MKLSANWFTEPVFDFEYKKYQLLGYIQEKEAELEACKIYPHIEELESHLKILHQFLETKSRMDDSFRKELNGFDFNSGNLIYENSTPEKCLDEFLDIILFSQKKINGCHRHFMTEAEEIKRKIQLNILGLIPSYLQEGFLLIRQKLDIFVFQYQLHPVLTSNGEKKFLYHYIEKHTPSLTVNEESVKKSLQKKYFHQYDHPVFFQLNSSPDFPIYETLLPFAGKELGRWVA